MLERGRDAFLGLVTWYKSKEKDKDEGGVGSYKDFSWRMW